MHGILLAGVASVALVLGGFAVAGLVHDAHADAKVAASKGVTTWPDADTTVAAKPKAGNEGWDIPQPVTMPSDPKQAALVKKGMFLTVAGDCLPCHSVAGEPALAGGRAVGTPFGTVFSTNLTSSKRYGIGGMTDKQFYAAVHDGIEPGSSLVIFPKYEYPVMPYTAYSKLTYSDVMAIKAYLDSLAPVRIKNRPDTMFFPTDLRAGMLAWRLLFFHPHPVRYQAGWSQSVRHGAYLVQALAHCNACHTPRNIAMASIHARYLAGGHIIDQAWYAPNITNSKRDGLGSWSDNAVFTYLYDDGDMKQGAPFGKMKSVVDDSLSRLPKADVQDIVAYLRTVKPLKSHFPSVAETSVSVAAGKTLYDDECARCHMKNGEGASDNIPNLAHNQAVWNGKPIDLIGMMLGGFEPWHKNQTAMPMFGATLSDGQIADIADYVRTAWGNRGKPDATANTVASLRPQATIEVDLNTGSTRASLSKGGKTRTFDDISGRVWVNGNRTDCRMKADFSNQYGKNPVLLGGACASQGNEFIGRATIDGKVTPVLLGVRQVIENGHVVGLDLSGDLGGGRMLDERIALKTTNY
ncbi:c-type cytochrome [Acidiphilium sp. PA]|uniref:c-type cytochrome n=1 Tax=Acidiphilium sp. PA TaxID=2871705 RepID=UPI0022430207|nr:c-type cytochrome [Acidiphilium sp. PA]MCW8307275.1 c-type cytochrome [Acidiphilium sp. PA]